METQTDVQLVSKYLDLMRLKADWAFVWADPDRRESARIGFHWN